MNNLIVFDIDLFKKKVPNADVILANNPDITIGIPFNYNGLYISTENGINLFEQKLFAYGSKPFGVILRHYINADRTVYWDRN